MKISLLVLKKRCILRVLDKFVRGELFVSFRAVVISVLICFRFHEDESQRHLTPVV